MLVKIMCKSKDKKTAYAYEIDSFHPVPEDSKKWFLSENPVCYIDNNSQYVCDISEIVENPIILNRCAGKFYKIAL